MHVSYSVCEKVNLLLEYLTYQEWSSFRLVLVSVKLLLPWLNKFRYPHHILQYNPKMITKLFQFNQ